MVQLPLSQTEHSARIDAQWIGMVSNRGEVAYYKRGFTRMAAAKNCVVISYYDQRDPAELVRLLRSMRKFKAGADYEILIVVNSTGKEPLNQESLPLRDRITITLQPNHGYNIGAWETGWRQTDADSLLFLQQECSIRQAGWLQAFLAKSQDPSLGLLGELRNSDWAVPWQNLPTYERFFEMPEHEINGVAVGDRVKCYLHYLNAWGIDPGYTADHLQSLVLFTRRKVLEAVGGFPVGRNYGEAIASEIGFSRKVAAAGFRLEQVGPKPFTWIQHPQWCPAPPPTLKTRILNSLRIRNPVGSD